MRRQLYSALTDVGFKGATGIHYKDLVNNVEHELDVAVQDKNVTIIFECKTTGDTGQLSQAIDKLSEIENSLIDRPKDEFKILSVDKGRWLRSSFCSANPTKTVLVAVREELTEGLQQKADAKRVYYWDDLAIRYFARAASAQGSWTKNELYNEVQLRPPTLEGDLKLPAIEIKQPQGTFYLISITPAELLEIAYVYRRAQVRHRAVYQRLVNRERLTSVRTYLSKPKAALPNDIIISFDKAVRSRVRFERIFGAGFLSVGKLTVPREYCSAWVVDGQHRLLGFLGTKYAKGLARFDLIVLATKEYDEIAQAQTFIDINYFQKKIDSTLLGDLSTIAKDLTKPLTWPSLLGVKLNVDPDSPWHNLIGISELHTKKERPIKLAGFVGNTLTSELIRYRARTGQFSGPLYEYAPFDTSKPFNSRLNQQAFQKQFDLLKRYFKGVREVTRKSNADRWANFGKYAITSTTGANALLLVLSRILTHERRTEILRKLFAFLRPLGRTNFSRNHVARYLGQRGFRLFANQMMVRLNERHSTKQKLKLYNVGS